MFKIDASDFKLGLDPKGIPWDAIAKIAFANVKHHFALQRGPEGPWEPLKVETWKRKIGPWPLYETGELYRSYQAGFGTDYAMVFSEGADWAVYHETGTSRNLPSRSFLWLDDMAGDKILRMTGESLTWSK